MYLCCYCSDDTISEASISTRTLGPTTVEVCWVQPIKGPDQVLWRWKVTNQMKIDNKQDFRIKLRKNAMAADAQPRPLSATQLILGEWGPRVGSGAV